MKKFTTFLAATAILILTSCTINEKLTMNEDGSGEMRYVVDLSAMMGMMGEEMEGEESRDTIMYFNDMFEESADSIAALPAAERAKLEKMRNWDMKMRMDGETGEFIIDMGGKFENIAGLSDVMTAMSNSPGGSGLGSEELGLDSSPSETLYAFDGTTLSRTTKVVDEEQFEIQKDSLADMAMMFSSIEYNMEYTFPRPVKMVDNENVTYSADRKTIYFNTDLSKVFEDPKAMNLTITLEDQ